MASSSSFQAKKYDVFISFKGSDVRKGFLSHLHKALKGGGFDIFVDENLHRGEDISSSLLKTIEQSYLSLVIFSENYAFSPWCLDELVKILECKKTMGQIVVPVFYGVDPTHVQHLTGSFGYAISKHRKENFQNSSCRVESWCQALKETAQLSGLVSQNTKHDSELIEEILENLNSVLPSYVCGNDRLVGIESRVNYVESLLHLESFDVRFIGIWGMGGIGKTTIAKQVFDRVGDQFPTKCFVENVREKSENCANATTSILNRRGVSGKKVLIVLDDVSDLEQVEFLIGKQVNYGPFSRIIVTSRDKQLLKNVAAQIYEVEGLDEREALSLFRLYAFKKSTPQEGYEMLSRRAVEYAQGLPLALKVMGSSLYSKSVEEWEDALESLQDTLDDHIQKILSISYEGPYEKDKDIFLYIARFFKGKDRDYAERILDVGSRIGISRLTDKSLISISNDKKIQIHDLRQKIGKDIICQEKQLGKRIRLWHNEVIYYVLTKNKRLLFSNRPNIWTELKLIFPSSRKKRCLLPHQPVDRGQVMWRLIMRDLCGTVNVDLKRLGGLLGLKIILHERFYACPNYKVINCGYFQWQDRPLNDRPKEIIKQLKTENRILHAENKKLKRSMAYSG